MSSSVANTSVAARPKDLSSEQGRMEWRRAVDALAEQYDFRQPAAIRDYLLAYPHLVPILEEATEMIPRFFGPEAPLALEIFVDPESEAEPPDTELFALVKSPYDAEETMRRLDQMDAEWWTDRSPRAPGVLVVSTE